MGKINNSDIKRGQPPNVNRCIKKKLLVKILGYFDDESDMHISTISTNKLDNEAVKKYGNIYWIITGMLNEEMTRFRVSKTNKQYKLSRIIHETTYIKL